MIPNEPNKTVPGAAGSKDTPEAASNFIRDIIIEDLKQGKNQGRITTRFPPEPNGYLHIGHAKSICLNFGLAAEFGGTCNLRFDDTNPTTEDVEYTDSIQEDVRWLGFDWEDRLYFASDYFEALYEFAIRLINEGKAYVCSLSEEEIKDFRGNYFKAAKPSPYRDRPIAESLDLFRRMRDGQFKEGEHVLRAKIDLASPNMNLRDPILYRVRYAHHHRTGDRWCIYPMYDFAHGQCDAFERITHSICTLEFEDHRPLYDWFLEQLNVPEPPRQIEFAKLNLSYTVLSKRKLRQMVEDGDVSGWDDPRMPTLSGLRRRGYTPSAIRHLMKLIGVNKGDSVVDIALLEYCLRQDLEADTRRVMGVMRPLRVVVTNYEADRTEEFDCPYLPEDFRLGSRKTPFSRELYIERDDFREDAPRKWHRLAPGQEVRLRYACLITCDEVVKEPNTGEVVELRCTMDPNSRGGVSPDGRRVKGTLHWVSAAHALDAEVRLYDRLFAIPNPTDSDDFKRHLYPQSLEMISHAKLEPSLAEAKAGERFQFERLGYFFVDPKDSKPGKPIFNRTVTLRDAWTNIEKAMQ